jgi:hypothetical protein
MQKRLARVLALSILISIISGLFAPEIAVGQLRHRHELSPVERAFVAAQAAVGRDRIALLIMGAPGNLALVLDKLKGISADIGEAEADVGFIRAKVRIERLQEVLDWSEISAVEIDTREEVGLLGDFGSLYTSPSAEPIQGPSKPGVPPSAATPANNPYTGESATEAFQFKAAFPRFDGRGVVIGGIEQLDPYTPSLIWGTTRDGVKVPKLEDYIMPSPSEVTVGPIATEAQKLSGLAWQLTVSVSPDAFGRFTFNQKVYLAPKNIKTQELRITLFRTSQDDLSPELTVLWAVQSHKLWILGKEQIDFNDGTEVYLPKADESAAFVRLGKNNRTISFAVDGPRGWLGTNLGYMEHGTMTASVAAGHNFLNSQAGGAAPGARFLPVVSGAFIKDNELASWPATGAESIIKLFRNPHVDLITYSGGATLGTRSRTKLDESLVGWQLVDRLTKRYPKLFIAAAGNAGAESQLSEWGNSGSAVVTIGAYTPRETWEANFGITPTLSFTPAAYTQYGPASDGGLKPDLLALTGTLCATSPRPAYTTAFGSPYYDVPAGYGISGGTSAAAPNAAGDVALLISAAKQSEIRYDPARLKIALFSTAEFLDGVEARVQGHGLIQVAKAWEALQKLKNYPVSTFTVQAPVHSYWSGTFDAPNTGRGLYEINWTPGQKGVRPITVTRTSGPSEPVLYKLRWHESVGAGQAKNNSIDPKPAFSTSLSEVKLPLNTPVKIPVSVAVGGSGVYSAILDLVDPTLDLVADSVMCTIIAAQPLTAPTYSTVIEQSAPRPGNGIVFVNVPAGAAALRIHVVQHNGKSVSLRAKMPNGRTPRSGPGDSVAWFLSPSDRKEFDHTFADPLPGVWQFWLTHDSSLPPSSYDPTEPRPALASDFTIQATAVDVSSDIKLSDIKGKNASVIFTSQSTQLNGAKIAPVGVGAMLQDLPTLRPGFRPVSYDVEIPAGTTKFEANVESVSVNSEDLSLALVKIPEDDRSPLSYVAYDISTGSNKHIELSEPNPGRYKIVITSWKNVPDEGVKLRYKDVIYNPRFGGLTVDDQSENLAVGQVKRAVFGWTAGDRPSDRKLVGELGLFANGFSILDASAWIRARTAARKAGKPMPDYGEIPSVAIPVATSTAVLDAP